MARGVLVLPILGKPFGAALEAGERCIELEDGVPLLRYFEHSLPLAPEAMPAIIGLPSVGLAASLADPASLTSLISVLDELPRATPDAAVALLREFQRLT